MISFAIPNYNRVDNVVKLVNEHADNECVSEIVICDDASRQEFIMPLREAVRNIPKVRLIENDTNYGLFRNKLRTVVACRQPWVVLCDSDNFMDKNYVDTLYCEEPWDSSTVYCPSVAGPFDFRKVAGQTMANLQQMETVLSQLGANFTVFCNTGNYFFNRDRYIHVCNHIHTLGLNPDQLWAAEVYAINFAWVALGGKIKCVEGLSYFHDTTNTDSAWRKIVGTREGRAASNALYAGLRQRIQAGR